MAYELYKKFLEAYQTTTKQTPSVANFIQGQTECGHNPSVSTTAVIAAVSEEMDVDVEQIPVCSEDKFEDISKEFFASVALVPLPTLSQSQTFALESSYLKKCSHSSTNDFVLFCFLRSSHHFRENQF